LKLLRPLLFLIAICAFTGCTTVSDLVTSNLPTLHEGKASIVVRLRQQKAFLHRGGEEVAEARISTGREGYGTPTGRFRVIRKDPDHRSGLYGDYVNAGGGVVKSNVDVRKSPKPAGSHFLGAPMPFFVEFKPGYGLHAGHLPGYPASHGCVRLSYWKARQFYNAAHIGTPVVVKQ
jgi:lipoprotein-anchoring transpeptidase ErfK/SrfK